VKGEETMTKEHEDSLLDKLGELKAPSLDPSKRIATLRAAEAAFGRKGRQARLPWRWPELALVSVIAMGSLLYTAESMAKIGKIYGHTVAAEEAERRD
jgi:hypothetical protein